MMVIMRLQMANHGSLADRLELAGSEMTCSKRFGADVWWHSSMLPRWTHNLPEWINAVSLQALRPAITPSCNEILLVHPGARVEASWTLSHWAFSTSHLTFTLQQFLPPVFCLDSHHCFLVKSQ